MNWFVKKLFTNKLFKELLSQYIWLNFEQGDAKKLRECYGLDEGRKKMAENAINNSRKSASKRSETLKKKFEGQVNARISYIKKVIEENKGKKITQTELAKLCGFNGRDQFNIWLRKHNISK